MLVRSIKAKNTGPGGKMAVDTWSGDQMLRLQETVVSTMIWQKFELFSLVQGHEQKDMRGETSANGRGVSVSERSWEQQLRKNKLFPLCPWPGPSLEQKN